MPVKKVPVTEQPEFDDVGPITFLDRILLIPVWPIAWLNAMVTLPFQVRRQSEMLLDRSYVPLTAEVDAAMMAPVRSFLDATETAAANIGFREPRRFSQPPAGGVFSFIPSETGEDLCLSYASHTPRRLTMTAMVFQTRFVDGRLIVTGNESAGGSRSAAPGHDGMTFPGVDDLAALYDLHRKRTRRAGGVAVRTGWTPPAANPVDLIQRAANEGRDEMIRLGYAERPATGGMRYTLIGATRSAWSAQFPLRQIRRWREARRAARARKDLA